VPCESRRMNEDEKERFDDRAVHAIATCVLTPHNRALYEAGKTILVDSISTAREFCKFMISLSIAAVPVYVGLLKLVLPNEHTISGHEGVIFFIPAALFLLAAGVFTTGYYPQTMRFSLDIIEEIEGTRLTVIRRRGRLASLGCCAFLAGTVAALWVVIGQL